MTPQALGSYGSFPLRYTKPRLSQRCNWCKTLTTARFRKFPDLEWKPVRICKLVSKNNGRDWGKRGGRRGGVVV